MDFKPLMQTRHSVRSFRNELLSEELLNEYWKRDDLPQQRSISSLSFSLWSMKRKNLKNFTKLIHVNGSEKPLRSLSFVEIMRLHGSVETTGKTIPISMWPLPLITSHCEQQN